MEHPSGRDGPSEGAALRAELVDALQNAGHIRTPRVAAAFRAVPRHVFVPAIPLDVAYSDVYVVTKEHQGEPISSSSQPAIMAIMLEQLDLHSGQRVLEIGAGTGYNAALMAHIVGETGRVVTVDIDDDIVANAQEHLRTAGFERVQVVCGDGALGYPHAAPYDRVILTAAAADIAPAWREQLAPHGRLVLPLELTPLALKNTTPALVTFKRADGYLESVALHACGFMPLRGSLAMHRTGVVPLGPEAGLTLVTAHPVEAAAMYTALTSPYRDTATGIRVTPREVGGLRLWLALLDAGFCYLYAEGAMTQRGLVPFLAGDPGTFVTAMGLAEETTLCLLILSPNAHPQLDQPLDADKPVELVARSFDTGTALSRRLTAQAIAWEKAGRPFAWSPQWTIQRGRISAYPLGTPYSRAANQAVVDKRSVRLVFTW